MRSLLPTLTLPTLILILAGAAACNPLGLTGTDDEARLRALYAEMIDLIGDAPADDVRACRTLAVGSKPCGGPTHYLVYSATATDSVRLHALAEEHAALQAKINRERGLVSNCALEMPPEVAIVDGACVAVDR